jgi:hypothetical protein
MSEMRQRETGATEVTVSGVQARNPLADGADRLGDEVFTGDIANGAGAENDFPIPGLADEEGFRADPATKIFAARRWASRPAGQPDCCPDGA